MVWMAWMRVVARLGLVRILRRTFQFFGVRSFAGSALASVGGVDLLLTD
jgi:hypothetical protein